MICDNNVEKRNIHMLFFIYLIQYYMKLLLRVYLNLLYVYSHMILIIHNHNHFVIVIHLIFSNWPGAFCHFVMQHSSIRPGNVQREQLYVHSSSCWCSCCALIYNDIICLCVISTQIDLNYSHFWLARLLYLFASSNLNLSILCEYNI